jgi:hypothetical protein
MNNLTPLLPEDVLGWDYDKKQWRIVRYFQRFTQKSDFIIHFSKGKPYLTCVLPSTEVL